MSILYIDIVIYYAASWEFIVCVIKIAANVCPGCGNGSMILAVFEKL